VLVFAAKLCAELSWMFPVIRVFGRIDGELGASFLSIVKFMVSSIGGCDEFLDRVAFLVAGGLGGVRELPPEPLESKGLRTSASCTKGGAAPQRT
jgi:hypothetical protein